MHLGSRGDQRTSTPPPPDVQAIVGLPGVVFALGGMSVRAGSGVDGGSAQVIRARGSYRAANRPCTYRTLTAIQLTGTRVVPLSYTSGTSARVPWQPPPPSGVVEAEGVPDSGSIPCGPSTSTAVLCYSGPTRRTRSDEGCAPCAQLCTTQAPYAALLVPHLNSRNLRDHLHTPLPSLTQKTHLASGRTCTASSGVGGHHSADHYSSLHAAFQMIMLTQGRARRRELPAHRFPGAWAGVRVGPLLLQSHPSPSPCDRLHAHSGEDPVPQTAHHNPPQGLGVAQRRHTGRPHCGC